jgi:uncharacterized surface protein with fasciclin (FAS1) repeats
MVVSCSDDDDDDNSGVGVGDGPTLAQVISDEGDLSTFEEALEIAGLTDMLQNQGLFTVFAPTNAAFDLMSEDAREELFGDSARLREVLLYHMASGRLNLENLENRTNVTSRFDNRIINVRTIDGGEESAEIVQLNYVANIVEPDIEAKNGIVHKISRVLTPPEGAPDTEEDE